MPTFLTQINWARTFYVSASLAVITALLHWLQPLLLPIVLAVLITFLLAPVVAWVERHLPSRVGAVVAVATLTVALVGGVAWLISNQFVSLINSLPQYEHRLRARVADFYLSEGVFDKLKRTIERVQQNVKKRTANSASIAAPHKGEVTPVRIVADEVQLNLRTVYGAAAPLLEPLASIAFAAVLVIFFLLGREDLRDRMMSVFGTERLALTTKALTDAGERISAYLSRQLYVNTGFGLMVSCGLYILGVPHPAMFGFIAAVLRYLPYVGFWIAALLPLLVTFLSTDGWTPLLQVLSFLAVLELITTMIIEPRLYGRGIGLSESATIIMVAFWTWLWGPLGLLVGTPLSVCLLVLGRHVPALGFLSVMLGDRPALDAHLSVYQRLLAGRVDEAVDLVEAQEQKDRELAAVFDEFVMPALARCREDVRNGVLQRDALNQFLASANALVAELRESELKPDLDVAGNPPRLVLAATARDAINHIALDLFDAALRPRNVALSIVGASELISEVVDQVATKAPTVFFVGAFAPGGSSRVRLLCVRLRSRFPELPIIVGRWATTSEDTEDHDKFRAAGATTVVTTLEEAREAVTYGVTLAEVEGSSHKERGTHPDGPRAGKEQSTATIL